MAGWRQREKEYLSSLDHMGPVSLPRLCHSAGLPGDCAHICCKFLGAYVCGGVFDTPFSEAENSDTDMATQTALPRP